MITSKNEVKVYELNDKESTFESEKLLIENHWNRHQFVCLTINGQKITVVAADLQAAIINATNTNR